MKARLHTDTLKLYAPWLSGANGSVKVAVLTTVLSNCPVCQCSVVLGAPRGGGTSCSDVPLPQPLYPSDASLGGQDLVTHA